ncbi:hypothetical protein P3X46_028901 [Hevea brasiliensis]|uniref:Exostosin GT47 domain-containing protein n=2 Tax=Hevea brasiliensis TaxID=3981 RepID=A0ABQ9KQL4_HEVBR|nr:hypothetical protein P3X46_028901 [Hevea brasiliensis]
MNINVTGNPIDNFFVGGDWDKYLDEISKVRKELKPDNQIHLTENEAQSINKVFDRGNEEESDKLVGSKENGVESVPVEEKIIEEVTEQEETMEDRTAGVEPNSDSDFESCSGRYIYVHDLPSQFNEDLIKHCRSLSEWSNMCPFISNFGLGPRLKNSERVLLNTGWFETNQFMLEVIFHNRMKQYKCLTNDSSLASAIFVPYYAGLDVVRYLWNSHRLMRDYYSLNLVKWLRETPEWKRLWGRDHFLVAGRITWDFRRLTNGDSDWGNRLMLLPESKNMTMLTIESSPWSQNDFAIPYPTYFHPSSDDEVFQWQNKMRRMKRRFLFSFAGGPRPNVTNSIRGEIIDQCQATRRKCKMLECVPGSNKCYKPVYVMKIFETSTFCLQPPGDSYTRRSTFDSILAGCIPVFFHPGSAYVQYLWHLPKDYTKYSVFIPANEVKNGKASIERILSRIPKAKILAMRDQVIKLIPGVVYADPRSTLETLEDAFDITIDGVLERIEQTRRDISEGKDVSDNGEEFTWKKTLFGTVGEHEWDPFFARS